MAESVKILSLITSYVRMSRKMKNFQQKFRENNWKFIYFLYHWGVEKWSVHKNRYENHCMSRLHNCKTTTLRLERFSWNVDPISKQVVFARVLPMSWTTSGYLQMVLYITNKSHFFLLMKKYERVDSSRLFFNSCIQSWKLVYSGDVYIKSTIFQYSLMKQFFLWNMREQYVKSNHLFGC